MNFRYFSHAFIIIGAFCVFKSGTYGQGISLSPEDFLVTGDAIRLDKQCYRLTEDIYWQSGGVWFNKAIDLSEPFSLEIEVNFGCRDLLGADGIVFIFHPLLRTGSAGEGMGFGRLSPSFGIEMDTYENFHLEDPSFDHVAYMVHGRLNHRWGLTSAVQLKMGSRNVEDCNEHHVTINWDPTTQLVQFYFDGSLRVNKEVDLINEIFGGNPVVYWGFTSATGDKYNDQRICIRRVEFTENFSLSLRDQRLLLDGEKYMLKNLNFAAGSIRLPEAVKPELDKLFDFFKKNPKYAIFLNGYTDSSGNAGQNENLSRLRAETIADYLVEKGMPSYRIIFRGHGEKDPIDSNATEEGRKRNRRVEIYMRILRV